MTLQDLQTALQNHAVMLYLVGAVTTCCCVLDLVRATVMPDQWQSLGDRTRRLGLRVLAAGANRRPHLVHDHTDTLSRHASLSLGLPWPPHPHVLPQSQPDIPMPPVQSGCRESEFVSTVTETA